MWVRDPWYLIQRQGVGINGGSVFIPNQGGFFGD